MTKFKAYAQLIRLPNLFTAAGDILAAYWLCACRVEASWNLAMMLVATACLYATGIVINDIHDLETDRRERPSRPLPSGRISIGSARFLATLLAAVGLVAAMLIPLNYDPGATASGGVFTLSNRSMIIGAALLGAVLLYDLVLKETILGPPAMGLCRALNFALGLSLAELEHPEIFRRVVPFLIAYWFYITSLTYFGRDEAGTIRKRRLFTGFVGIELSILALGVIALPMCDLDGVPFVLWLVLLVHITRVTWRTVRNPSPERMQFNMKTLILCTLLWNGVIAAAATRDWVAPAIVLGLLIPTLILGRRIYST